MTDPFFGDQTIICPQCNHMVLGNEPARSVLCHKCVNTGIVISDCVVCMQCAYNNSWTGTPATHDSHPDGFTCDECGVTIIPDPIT